MKILFFASLLWSTVHQNYGQESECRTPDLGVGICKPLIECTDLVEKAYKIKKDLVPKFEQKTIRTELSQRKLVCRDDANNKYCCSNCITPDGRSGIITKISDCPSLYKLAVDKKNIEYLRKSRVGNTKTFCCGGTSVEMPTPSKSKCDELIGTPPDPESGCCGIDSSVGSRIVGREDVGIREFPWTVLLEYKRRRKINCGGSLISNRHVITLARCVSDLQGQPIRVRVGEYIEDITGPDCILTPDLREECTDGAQSITIESILKHPMYNEITAYNDIALIRLATAVNYTDFTRPICLPSNDVTKRKTEEQMTYMIAGWGKLSENARFKKAAQVNYVKQQVCQNAYTFRVWSRNYRLWDQQICAGGASTLDTCVVDQGGPLMVEAMNGELHYELAGVASFGHKQCETVGLPTVYTHVYQYLDWIKQSILQN